jgi:sec-independent protein translocase protein TatA
VRWGPTASSSRSCASSPVRILFQRRSRPVPGANLAGVFQIGPLELLVVLVIALLVIGPAKLPDVARSLGRGMREFRTALSDESSDDRPEPAPVEPPPAAQAPPPAAQPQASEQPPAQAPS